MRSFCNQSQRRTVRTVGRRTMSLRKMPRHGPVDAGYSADLARIAWDFSGISDGQDDRPSRKAQGGMAAWDRNWPPCRASPGCMGVLKAGIGGITGGRSRWKKALLIGVSSSSCRHTDDAIEGSVAGGRYQSDRGMKMRAFGLRHRGLAICVVEPSPPCFLRAAIGSE